MRRFAPKKSRVPASTWSAGQEVAEPQSHSDRKAFLMNVDPIRSRGTRSSRSSRQTMKRWVPVMSVTLLAIMGAVGNVSIAAASARPKTLVPTASKMYFSHTGVGDKKLYAAHLPKAWTVAWTFDCQSPATTDAFVLTSAKVGKKSSNVAFQSGLGGGGYKAFHGKGSYKFGVTTTCGWKVTVGHSHSTGKSNQTKMSIPRATTTTTRSKSTTSTTR
jgi:hypothetical protein